MLPYDPTRVALYSPEQHETLFERERSYSDLQLGIEAARLAYVRAERSAGELARLTAALARVGFLKPEIFLGAVTETRAFASFRPSDRTALIAFRGTQPDSFDDLFTDAQLQWLPWSEGKGRVHRGFALAFRSVRAEVQRWLDALPKHERLILTGHSLGAAIATLASSIWRPTSLVTLGSPRVGDKDFIATIQGIDGVRIVDCCDVVTDVPPEFLGYRHIGVATYIARNGELLTDPGNGVVAADRVQAELEYVKAHAWKATDNVLTRRLADHAPINYARAFF